MAKPASPATAREVIGARIQPDSRAMSIAVTWLMAALGTTGFVAGVPGLLWAAQLASAPALLAWTAPVLLDAGLVIFALSAVVRRSRHEPAVFSWAALAVLTVLSAGAQVSHVLSTTTAATPAELGVGLVVGALPPAMVFAATHAWLDLAVGAPVARKNGRRPATTHVTRIRLGTATPSVRAVAPVPVVPVEPAAHAAPPAPRAPRVASVAVDPAEVLRLAEEGLSQRQIAERLGSSKSSVARAIAKAEAEAEPAAA